MADDKIKAVQNDLELLIEDLGKVSGGVGEDGRKGIPHGPLYDKTVLPEQLPFKDVPVDSKGAIN